MVSLLFVSLFQFLITRLMVFNILFSVILLFCMFVLYFVYSVFLYFLCIVSPFIYSCLLTIFCESFSTIAIGWKPNCNT